MYGVVLETPIIWKNDVVFQYIFVLLAEKKKKVYPVFISGVFICILMDYGFMTNIIDNMLSLCPVSEDTIQELKKCMILCRFPKKYQLIKENTVREKAIKKMGKQNIKDIYAISFWKDNLEDDPRCPVITIGYNTLTQVEVAKRNASSLMEAKWNYAFWLQNEVGTIGGNDKNLRLYFKEANLFYTQQEYSRAEKNGEENKLDEQDDQMQLVFMDIIISVIQELHKRGVIKEQLGKEVPVIVHELEYYDLPIMWTTRSNPKSLIDEFLKSYNDGCL